MALLGGASSFPAHLTAKSVPDVQVHRNGVLVLVMDFSGSHLSVLQTVL